MSVFISYSTKQADKAWQVCAYLEENGIPCWIAPRDIRPGSNYASEIVHAISDCSYLLLLASVDTNSSNYVLNEVTMAFDKGKMIIPFKLQDIELSDEFRFFLGSTHWIEAFRDFDAGLRQLLRTLGARPAEAPVSPVDISSPPRERRAGTVEYTQPEPTVCVEQTVNIAVPPPAPAPQPVVYGGKFFPKSKWTALFLCLFFGWLGAHKFYERKYFVGIVYLLTMGLGFVGVVFDLIRLLMKPNPYFK